MSWPGLWYGLLFLLTPVIEATAIGALPAGLSQATLFPAVAAACFTVFSPEAATAVVLLGATWRDLALVAPAGATLAGAVPMALAFVALPGLLTNHSRLNLAIVGASAAGTFLIAAAGSTFIANRLGFPVAVAIPGVLAAVSTVLLAVAVTAMLPMAARPSRRAGPQPR